MSTKKSTSDYCPEPVYRSEESFKALMKDLKSTSFSTERLEFLKEEVPKDPRVFSKV